MLVRAPYILPFILTVCCWFRHNAAITLAFHSPIANQIQSIYKEEKTDSQHNWNNAATHFRTKRNVPAGIVYENEYKKTTSNLNDHNSYENTAIINQNLNILHRKERRKRPEVHVPITTTHNPKNLIKDDQSINCTSGKKKNQRYSSSFIGNTTNGELNVDKDFDDVIGNNSKAKRTGSIHVGEDITLCWIETTTIKENKTTKPPKKLVIREYTISFENSATIPDRYLECKRLEGELATNDLEIGKTALFDIIDEDTKVSRTVNFTTVSHVGDVVIWQHKTVKCGVGPVVSKNIIEWTDGTKNPKKRVEIKVSPKMHQLTATKTEEEPCTEEIEESTTEFDNSTQICESAKNGVCEGITESNENLTKYPEVSTTEGIITELIKSEATSESESEENLSLFTGTTKPSTLSREEISTRLSTVAGTTKIPLIPEKNESIVLKKNIEDCEEDSSDPMCIIQKYSIPSSEETSTELPIMTKTFKDEALSTISISTKVTSEIPDIASEVITEEEEKSLPDEIKLSTTEFSSISSEEGVPSTLYSLVSEKTTRADISVESSEFTTSQGVSVEETIGSTDSSYTDNTAATKLETKTNKIDIEKSESKSSEESEIGTSTTAKVSAKEYSPVSEEVSDSSIGKNSKKDFITVIPIETTSEASSYIPSLDVGTTASVETESIEGFEDITTMKPLFEVTEFTEKSEKSDKVLDKLTGPSSTEGTIEPFLISEETHPGRSGETVILAVGTTIGLKATGKIELLPVTSTTTSLPRIVKPIVLPPTTSSGENLCENSEDCAYVGSSEVCDELGNCDKTTTYRSCESGECTEEEITEDHSRSEATLPTTTESQLHMTKLQSSAVQTTMKIQHTTSASITTTTLTSREAENSSTTVNNVSTTMESRRSTLPSTPIMPQHKLTLKIKVLLEHVNEKKEKQNLIEVEKHLSLSENLENQEHADLLEQLKFLNNSMNIDTISALLNCTICNLGKLAKAVSFIGKQPNNTDSSLEGLEFASEDLISQQISSENVHIKYEDSYPEFDHELVSRNRRRRSLDMNDKTKDLNKLEIKRNLFDPNDSLTLDSDKSSIITAYKNTELRKKNIQPFATINNSEMVSAIENISNDVKMEVVQQTLSEIQEDILTGFQKMVSQLVQNNLTLANDVKKMVKTNLLDIIADPTDDRIHTRRKRAITEEIGRWSNERIEKAPMGGDLRSFIEFILYKVLA